VGVVRSGNNDGAVAEHDFEGFDVVEAEAVPGGEVADAACGMSASGSGSHGISEMDLPPSKKPPTPTVPTRPPMAVSWCGASAL
jgi:hypothetical protein